MPADVISLLNEFVPPDTCRLKVNGKEEDVVHLVIQDKKYFAMIAGGFLVEVDSDTFTQLQATLRAHFFRNSLRKHNWSQSMAGKD